MVLHHWFLLLSLVVAIISPIVYRYIKLPLSVTEFIVGILFGFLIRDAGLSTPDVGFLANIGLLVLMFIAGFEIDFDFLEDISLESKVFMVIYLLSLPIFGFFVVSTFGLHKNLFIIPSLISAGLGLPVLKDFLEDSDFTKKLLALACIGETITVFELGFLNIYLSNRSDTHKLLDLFSIFFFIMLIFLLFLKAKNKLEESKIIKHISSSDKTHIFIRLSLLLIFLASSVFSFVNLEPALGALMVGLFFGYFIREKHSVNKSLSDMAFGFLIPIFFVYTGSNMHIEFIGLNSLDDGIKLFVSLFLVKFGMSFWLLKVGFKLKELPIIGIFLSFPFTMLIISMRIFQDANISLVAQNGIIIATILSSFVYPYIFRAIVSFMD